MKPTDKTKSRLLGQAQDYPGLLLEIKERIRAAQYEALRSVNRELVGLYWDIGRMIVERQDAEGWARRWWHSSPQIYRRNFPVWAAFRHPTYGG
jgi:hypothetical protein